MHDLCFDVYLDGAQKPIEGTFWDQFFTKSVIMKGPETGPDYRLLFVHRSMSLVTVA